MDFKLTSETIELQQKFRNFVDEVLLPLERDSTNFDKHENIKLELLESIRAEAKLKGLWSPQASVYRGGLGLSVVEQAAIYEEANRSIFGPVAFNCAAPDDGNISLMTKIGTEEQNNWWLDPLIEGKVRSSFAMTEPHPGAGSDPGMMKTTAVKKGAQWEINGRKWFITGAGEASHFILVAKTSEDPRRGLTAFLFHKDQPGWRIVRRIGIMGPEEHGGHCELEFSGLKIPDANRLMEVGEGLKVTQIRLGHARLTHCMRWLGLAKRAMEIAREYISKRESFGLKLLERESVQIKLGKLAQEIQIGRLLVMHAAWKLDQGDYARKEVSSAKIHVANVLHNAADTAIQLNGARGYSKDTVLEWIYRYARQARIVDGSDEVHLMVLGNQYVQEEMDYWKWGI